MRFSVEDEAQSGPDAVFDCNTFFRATINGRDPAAECVIMLGSGRYTLFYCRDILAEINDVLRRPSLRQQFPRLTDENVGRLVWDIERYAILIHNVPETFRYARDPDDEVYINLALITNAQYLVTYDNDLLDLMTGEGEEARTFRHRFPGLRIVDPQAFLEALDQSVSA